MSEQLRESLSAAMDGEADAFELRRVLDEAKQDEALREQWHRFHLLRDFMRKDIETFHPGLREQIWRGLHDPAGESEATAELVLAEESIAQADRRSPWVGRLTGIGVAVAAAVLVVVNGGVFNETDAPADFATAGQLPSGADLEPAMYQQATAVDQQRQNALMLHHIQQRAMNQAGVASFVKLATFSNTRVTPVAPPGLEEGARSP